MRAGNSESHFGDGAAEEEEDWCRDWIEAWRRHVCRDGDCHMRRLGFIVWQLTLICGRQWHNYKISRHQARRLTSAKPGAFPGLPALGLL